MTDSRPRGRFLIGTSPAPWARHALTLLALVWLNVAVQPCAMAMAPGSGLADSTLTGAGLPISGERVSLVPGPGIPEAHHCPHCPPAQHRPVGNLSDGADHTEKAIPGHQGHGSTAGERETVDPVLSTSTDCLDSPADCGVFGRMAPDGRGGDLKVKPSPELVYLAPAWPMLATHPATELPPRWRALSYLPGPPPALNCLYCVYLK